MSTSNNVTTRIKPLLNFIFVSDLQAITEDLRIMDVCKSAIAVVINLCTSFSYFTENGCCDWQTWSRDVQYAIGTNVDAQAVALALATQRAAIDRAVVEASERDRAAPSTADASMDCRQIRTNFPDPVAETWEDERARSTADEKMARSRRWSLHVSSRGQSIVCIAPRRSGQLLL